MKNRKIIIFLIVIVIVFIGIYLYNDYTRVIENVTNYSTGDNWAYSLKDTGNQVMFTLYQKYGPFVKRVTIYNIDDNKVSSITYEEHYINKLSALQRPKEEITDATNIIVKDNVVYYNPTFSGEIGFTKEKLMEELTAYGKPYIKVIEK